MILNPSNVGGGFMGGDMGKWWLPLREGKKYFGGTRTMYFNWKFNIFYGQAHTDILYSHCTKIRHFKWKIHFCLTKETSPSRTHLDGRELPLHTLPLAPSLTGSFTALCPSVPWVEATASLCFLSSSPTPSLMSLSRGADNARPDIAKHDNAGLEYDRYDKDTGGFNRFNASYSK